MENKSVKIVYKNYRGEISTREIIPEVIWFGSTDWHKEPQWILDAFDLGKDAKRGFAIKDIQSWTEKPDK